MNSENHGSKKMRGSAMIYIILALALLGALTMVISRQNDQTQSTTYEETEILTTKLMGYVSSTKSVVDQMVMSGTPEASLNFVKPNVASYDTAPHADKVFHPEGGGLAFQAADTTLFPGTVSTPARGWYVTTNKNIQWTPTTANDIIVVAYGISQAVCQNINRKTRNATTIPAVVGTFKDILLSTSDGGGTDTLNLTSCAACDGSPSLCISDNLGTFFAYYSVIAAQ